MVCAVEDSRISDQSSTTPLQKEALAEALSSMSPAQRKIALFAVEKIGGFFRSAYSQPLDASTLEPGSLGEHLSIGKAWHGAHFLFSGGAEPTPTPLGQAILGGVEIGEDTGYGPPRYLDHDAVDGITKALSSVDEAELRRRYDGDAMNAEDLYPDVWTEADSVDWLVDECDRVREFYLGAASRGNAVLLYHI
jgi:hypothetical protein